MRIITDSSADMREDYRRLVMTVPMTLRFGNEEFIDGVTISKQNFYERLVESDVLPQTSQATPEAFRKCFEEVRAAGESAVVLTISSKLSGTYQSACLAAEEFEHVYVVDTMSAAIGAGILAEYAVDCAARGMEPAALAAHLEEKKRDVCVIALLDTLEYLKKGGRISKATAVAGGLLNIKPVLTISDGEILMLGKARGSRQGNNLLVQKIRDTGGIDFSLPILLGYTGLSDALLKKYVEDSRALWENGTQCLHSTLLCSIIGTHVGPGVVAAAFFRRRAS